MAKRFLIMATNGFEADELFVPRALLLARGCTVALASPTTSPIQATVLDDPGPTIRPDLKIADARAADWDALLLPGGLINPDALRVRPEAIELVKAFADAGKPVGAICHAPWLLIEAGLVAGRRVTGWHSIRTDLLNAGGILADEAVVVDRGIVTAVGPGDSSAFVIALMDACEPNGS